MGENIEINFEPNWKSGIEKQKKSIAFEPDTPSQYNLTPEGYNADLAHLICTCRGATCLLRNQFPTYDPKTGEINSVVNSVCSKSYCDRKKKKYLDRGIKNCRQIILKHPRHLIVFEENLKNERVVQKKHLGKIVACLCHFPTEDVKHFWEHGFLSDTAVMRVLDISMNFKDASRRHKDGFYKLLVNRSSLYSSKMPENVIAPSPNFDFIEPFIYPSQSEMETSSPKRPRLEKSVTPPSPVSAIFLELEEFLQTHATQNSENSDADLSATQSFDSTSTNSDSEFCGFETESDFVSSEDLLSSLSELSELEIPEQSTSTNNKILNNISPELNSLDNSEDAQKTEAMSSEKLEALCLNSVKECSFPIFYLKEEDGDAETLSNSIRKVVFVFDNFDFIDNQKQKKFGVYKWFPKKSKLEFTILDKKSESEVTCLHSAKEYSQIKNLINCLADNFNFPYIRDCSFNFVDPQTFQPEVAQINFSKFICSN